MTDIRHHAGRQSADNGAVYDKNVLSQVILLSRGHIKLLSKIPVREALVVHLVPARWCTHCSLDFFVEAFKAKIYIIF